jgi:glycerate kinase
MREYRFVPIDQPSILIAPGPFKECLSSFHVSEAMRRGVDEILPEANVIMRPLCDGGSGFAQILTEGKAGRLEKVEVKDPFGEPRIAELGFLGDGRTSIIESASAAGLSLIPKEKRKPAVMSTYGVGELINQAVVRGARKIIVGCGDSGTNDCGIGCAAALGVKFYKNSHKPALNFPVGGDLINLTDFEYTNTMRRFENIEVIVACNLTSILCGPEGTTKIYAKQKGASPIDIDILHKGVEHFVDLVFRKCGVDMSYVPGAGGAGGLAASLYAFLGAKLLYSIDLIDQYLQLDDLLSQCHLVLTGEGRIDDRTATGKVACGLALKAKKYNLPVVAVVGSIDPDHQDIYYNGIDAVECICDGPMTTDHAIAEAPDLIQKATARVMRFIFKIPCLNLKNEVSK